MPLRLFGFLVLAGLTACQPATEVPSAVEPPMPYTTSADHFIMGALELEETTTKARAGDLDSAVRVAAHYRESAAASEIGSEEIYWLEAAISLGDVSSRNVLAFRLMNRRAPGDCAKALLSAEKWRLSSDLDEAEMADNGKSHLENDILQNCSAQ